MPSIVILLPYDVGFPHYLWTPGGSAVISAQAGSRLREFGISLTNHYRMVDGAITEVGKTPAYPSPFPLNLAGAKSAVDAGELKLSKKARRLLEL